MQALLNDDLLSIVFSYVENTLEFALVSKQFCAIFERVQFFAVCMDSKKQAKYLITRHNKNLCKLIVEHSKDADASEYWKLVQQLLKQYAGQLEHVELCALLEKLENVVVFENLVSLHVTNIGIQEMCKELIGMVQAAPKLQRVFLPSIDCEGFEEYCTQESYGELTKCLQNKQVEMSVTRNDMFVDLLPSVTNYTCHIDNHLYSALAQLKNVTSLCLEHFNDPTFKYEFANFTLNHLEKLQHLTLINVGFASDNDEKQFFGTLPMSVKQLKLLNCEIRVFPTIEHLNLDSLLFHGIGLNMVTIPEWMNAKKLRKFVFHQYGSIVHVPMLAQKIELSETTASAMEVFNASKTHISIHSCALIGENAKPMPKLKYLEISGTRTMQFDNFALVPNIRDIRFNRTESDWNKLSFCTILHTIKLNSCNLVCIPPVLATLPSLQSLKLNSNDIVAIPDLLFDGTCSFPSLQKLVIKDNSISSLPSVSTLPCLTHVKIDTIGRIVAPMNADMLQSIHGYIETKFSNLEEYLTKDNVNYCIQNPIRKQFFVNYAISVLEMPYFVNYVFHFVIHAKRFTILDCKYIRTKKRVPSKR